MLYMCLHVLTCAYEQEESFEHARAWLLLNIDSQRGLQLMHANVAIAR